MESPIFENDIKIKKRIQAAFENLDLPTQVADDIGFHMTDWLNDVREMEKLYANIETRTDDEIIAFVMGFLAHVPNHLNAAMKLSGIGRVQDIFEVGIFEDDE